MDMVMLILQVLVGLVSLVCFIIVVIKMFQNGETGIGLTCALLFWCIGGLIALIYGWKNAKAWGISPLMTIWTIAIIIGIILRLASAALTR